MKSCTDGYPSCRQAEELGVWCEGVCAYCDGPDFGDAESDAAQNWKGMDGAIAWHLIERHADGWGDVGAMMNAWLRANGGTVANVEITGRTLAQNEADGAYGAPVDCCVRQED